LALSIEESKHSNFIQEIEERWAALPKIIAHISKNGTEFSCLLAKKEIRNGMKSSETSKRLKLC